MSLTLTSSEAPPRVNQRELAKILGVSRVTISAYLDRYSEFPVLQSGANGREWIFDPVAAIAFLKDREVEEEAEEARRQAAIAQLGLPIEEAGPGTDILKPRERLDNVRAMAAEDDLRLKRGFLVSVPAERQVLTAAIARWNRALHAAVRQAARDFNLPEAVARAMMERVADTQRQFVRELSLETAEDAERLSA